MDSSKYDTRLAQLDRLDEAIDELREYSRNARREIITELLAIQPTPIYPNGYNIQLTSTNGINKGWYLSSDLTEDSEIFLAENTDNHENFMSTSAQGE